MSATAKFESRGAGWPTYGFPGQLSCYSLPTTSFLFNAPNEKADSSYVGDSGPYYRRYMEVSMIISVIILLSFFILREYREETE